MVNIHNKFCPALFLAMSKIIASFTLVMFTLTGCQSAGGFNGGTTTYAYYSSIGYMQGVPHGIGKLSYPEYKARELSYKLETNNGKLVAYSRVNSYGSLQEDRHNNKSSQWSLTYDTSGTLESITSYDNKRRVISTQLYSYDATKTKATIQLKLPTGRKTKGYKAPLYRNSNRYDHSTNKAITHLYLVFNKKGLTSELGFLNDNLEEAIDRDGASIKKFSYNEFNDLTRESYFSSKQSTSNNNILRKTQYTYDNKRNLTSSVYYIYEANPALQLPPYAQIRNTYDTVGNKTGSTFYNSDANPSRNVNNYLQVSIQHDSRGNLIEETCLLNDSPDPKNARSSHFIRTMQFDNKGRLIKLSNFDGSRNPKKSSSGVFSLTHTYDEKDQLIKTSYFGKDNKPVIRDNGSAALLRTYDNNGYIIEYAFLGIMGEPVTYGNSFSKERRSYDQHGNAIRFDYYGTDGEPTLTKPGYATITRRHDHSGNHIQSAFLGVDGKPITLKKTGYSKIKFKFNELNQAVENTYFGLNNQPVKHKRGHFKKTYEYDRQGDVSVKFHDK